ncbi:MAG: aspartate kinase [Bacteroidota bacterium]|nr:aspartate kinase [Bacteroidota bacterium]
MIVMKFGGTSTQDAQAIGNVVRIIRSHVMSKPIVVISAIAQATNMLEKIGKLASEKNDREAREVSTQLFNRHYAIVDQLIRHISRNRTLRNVLETTKEEIDAIIKGITILRELTPRTLDALFSYGELLSSRIVTVALQDQGIDSEWIDTKDFMITDENFSRAMPLMEEIEDRLRSIAQPLIVKGIVPVTQGFIGVTSTGRRTTMGRESSDFSAAIIGVALDADDIQIWTDVDGVLTADPTVVENPKKIKQLSFEEAYELSYFGAKVLHPSTMLPAIEKSIPIHIYNSRKPQSKGTLVSIQLKSHETIVKSVAYKRNVIILNVQPKKRFGQYIFWEHIHNVLTKYNVIGLITVTSEYSYSVVLDAKNFNPAVVHDLSEIGMINLIENMGIVSIIGSNLIPANQIIDKLFKAVGDIGISMITFGASKSNLSFIVDDDDVTEAVQKIHDEFFEEIYNDEVFAELDSH